MVLFVSCPTSSLVSSTTTTSSSTRCTNDGSSSTTRASSEFCYELTTTTTTSSNDDRSCHRKSDPIPVSRNRCDEHGSSHPLERLASPLATSAESVDSIKSSCSSRSSAERELERAERRHLLDLGLGKLRGQNNMPLRKHLLVFNTVKALQRDLDMLDDEDLYCSLLGMSNDATGNNHQMIGCGADDMEIDEFNWLPKRVGTPIGAPLELEEHQSIITDNNISVSTTTTSLSDDDFEMDDVMEIDSANDIAASWSWTSETSLFDSLHESKNEKTIFNWSSSPSSWNSEHLSNSGGAEFGWNPSSNNSFDLWGSSSDPFGVTRFDFQHLFPSQLLLQA